MTTKQGRPHLMKINQFCLEFGFTKYAVYELIKTDPRFPVINIGPKKNYRIIESKIDEWLKGKDGGVFLDEKSISIDRLLGEDP